MANTRTVGASGKDHTTIGSAVAWMQSNHTFGTDGIGTISVEDNAEYNENVDIAGISGTSDASNYIRLTAAIANRHTGIAGTGHARIRSSAAGHSVTIQENYTIVEYLEIQVDSSGNSDETIRVATNGDRNTIISRCILWSDTNTDNQDGIYTGNWEVVNLNIDHCSIYGFARAGIHIQAYVLGLTQTINVDYTIIYGCGASGANESGGINAFSFDAGNTININVYNTYCTDTASTYDDYSERSGNGTINWAGTNNACSDTSLTSRGIATNAQESLTVTDELVSVAGGSEDFHIKDTGATLYQNATNRVGSEPDARQDFSTDFEGDTRSTTSPDPDIGCDEFIAAVGGVTVDSWYTVKENPVLMKNEVISY